MVTVSIVFFKVSDDCDSEMVDDNGEIVSYHSYRDELAKTFTAFSNSAVPKEFYEDDIQKVPMNSKFF